MKKVLFIVLSLLVIALLVVSCGGSGSSDAATEAVTDKGIEVTSEPSISDLVDAIENMGKLTSYEAELSRSMKVSMPGVVMEMTSEGVQKVEKNGDSKISFAEMTDTDYMGKKKNTETYIENGISYVNEDGFKYVTEDESTEIILSELIENSDAVESFTFELIEDGGVRYDTVLTDATTEKLLEQIKTAEEEELYDEIELTGSSFTVKNGYCIDVEFVIETVSSDEKTGEIKTVVTSRMTVKDPGKEVKVPVPEDLASYEKLSDAEKDTFEYLSDAFYKSNSSEVYVFNMDLDVFITDGENYGTQKSSTKTKSTLIEGEQAIYSVVTVTNGVDTFKRTVYNYDGYSYLEENGEKRKIMEFPSAPLTGIYPTERYIDSLETEETEDGVLFYIDFADYTPIESILENKLIGTFRNAELDSDITYACYGVNNRGYCDSIAISLTGVARSKEDASEEARYVIKLVCSFENINGDVFIALPEDLESYKAD